MRKTAFNLLGYSSLVLIVYGGLIAQVNAATHARANNVIRIWIIGSPHTGDLPKPIVPSEFRRQVENLGYTIDVQTFRAMGFAAKFRQALQEHNEPEVLTFDNYGVLSGIRTANGWFDGIVTDYQTASSLVLVHEALGSLLPPQRGWVMLIRSAINYEAARTLSMRRPVCNAELGVPVDSPTIEPQLRQALETASFAARAYLSCDQSTLSVVSDASRLGQKCFLADSDTQVDSVRGCRVSGNRNLAFVSLVSTFSSQRRVFTDRGSLYGGDLGQQSIFAVLRKSNGAWQLLAITDDPVNTVARSPLTTPALERLLDDEQASGFAPEPAQLLTPDGVYPLPAAWERFGDFAWEPSQSKEVIGQIVEFLFGKDTSRGRTRLFFLPRHERKLSSGYLLSGGKSAWRVWSISKSGDLAFSQQRTYTR